MKSKSPNEKQADWIIPAQSLVAQVPAGQYGRPNSLTILDRVHTFMPTTKDILFEVKGRAGIVTLNRPGALNAVTDEMLIAIDSQLDIWEADSAVLFIIIKAVPGRAFSAGGDIRYLYEEGAKGHFDIDFFAREYVLNRRIHLFPKPYIALIDGITMGGGVGVSFHGSHRVVGERARFAMPEVTIGFFPDVGGSYLLSRLPGHLGLYLGMTGDRISAEDCFWTGLATHACPSANLAALEDDICALGAVDDLEPLLEAHHNTVEPGQLRDKVELIDQAFGGDTLEDVFQRLEKMGEDEGRVGEFASRTLGLLAKASPTSLAVAFQQIRLAATMSMPQCMGMEFRILNRLLPQAEFYEGIRAAIIDKDASPVWNPSDRAGVDAEFVNECFAPLNPQAKLRGAVGDWELPQ